MELRDISSLVLIINVNTKIVCYTSSRKIKIKMNDTEKWVGGKMSM